MSDAPYRVLHVEDNEFFARVTASVLGDEYGMAVRTATSASDALELLDSEGFDCIVSDYEMPGMDGLAFLDAVRERGSEVPFILLTGGGSEEIASEAISAGVTDYLQKGSGTDQFAVLANRIENAVARRRSERRATRQIAVNDRIWDVSKAVLQASSPEDIERTVCERLADADPYLLAWVGDIDEGAKAVCPQASAGIERRYLDPVALDGGGDESADHATPGTRLIRRAVETGTVRVGESAAVETGEEPETEVETGEEPGTEVETDVLEPEVDGCRCTIAAVPLTYEETIYGVLSLWSDERDAFGETERRVLSKFGSNVAYAIDSVQTRKELVRREQRLQVFNRILRHNLRNDLNVVLGHADNLTEEYPVVEDEAATIKRKASELIEISEKAREVGKTLDREDHTDRQVDVTDCIRRSCSELRQSYPDADITVDLPDSATVFGDKTLEAAISEVLENAIEHNDTDRPSVRVTASFVEDEGEWVEVTILDDGPGIPEEERAVLIEGEETALHHGSGLGLWLTNWIVGKFGGELSFDDYHTDGGAVTLRLQRATESLRTTPSF
ncbi:response regulator (plasmid) [Halorussus salilacus]|uniref:response regulator n=1 Tax=Halorussus salilacus TaxID=2953750 RepID=UPI00209E39F0|nr:response regulator [Halorussus salilacus]USZ69975.1 response regulator [Halorussus salilacus]